MDSSPADRAHSVPDDAPLGALLADLQRRIEQRQWPILRKRLTGIGQSEKKGPARPEPAGPNRR